jgi:molybdenum cofactor biosynthesis enzyme MoaA
MDAAEEAGLGPLKVNMVLLRDSNAAEILDFAAFARATGRIVRFIEFMPLDADGKWDGRRRVPDSVSEPESFRGSASHTDDDGCTRIIAKKGKPPRRRLEVA